MWNGRKSKVKGSFPKEPESTDPVRGTNLRDCRCTERKEVSKTKVNNNIRTMPLIIVDGGINLTFSGRGTDQTSGTIREWWLVVSH